MKYDEYMKFCQENISYWLEQGVIPWQQPWVGRYAKNGESKRDYSGMNQFLLSMIAARYFDGDPRYYTFDQAVKLGYEIPKGTHGYPAFFFTSQTYRRKKDENGADILDEKGKPVMESVKIKPIFKTYMVFNAKQLGGVPEYTPEVKADYDSEAKTFDQKTADALLSNSPVPIHNTALDSAFYSPKEDAIRVPAQNQFRTQAGYYSTVFHEMTHSTGIPSRLARECMAKYLNNTKARAKEELIAQISGLILANSVGLTYENANGAQYIGDWNTLLSSGEVDFASLYGDISKAIHYLKYPNDRERMHALVKEGKDLVIDSATTTVETVNDLLASSASVNQTPENEVSFNIGVTSLTFDIGTSKALPITSANEFLMKINNTEPYGEEIPVVVHADGKDIPLTYTVVNNPSRNLASWLSAEGYNRQRMSFVPKNLDDAPRVAEIKKENEVGKVLSAISLKVYSDLFESLKGKITQSRPFVEVFSENAGNKVFISKGKYPFEAFNNLLASLESTGADMTFDLSVHLPILGGDREEKTILKYKVRQKNEEFTPYSRDIVDKLEEASSAVLSKKNVTKEERIKQLGVVKRTMIPALRAYQRLYNMDMETRFSAPEYRGYIMEYVEAARKELQKKSYLDISPAKEKDFSKTEHVLPQKVSSFAEPVVIVRESTGDVCLFRIGDVMPFSKADKLIRSHNDTLLSNNEANPNPDDGSYRYVNSVKFDLAFRANGKDQTLFGVNVKIGEMPKGSGIVDVLQAKADRVAASESAAAKTKEYYRQVEENVLPMLKSGSSHKNLQLRTNGRTR